MAAITTREGLKQYCLRRLGVGAHTINVTDEQLEDRMDDAFQFYYDNHFDGTEKQYFSYEVAQDDIDNGYFAIPEQFSHVINVLPFGARASGTYYPMGDPSLAWNSTSANPLFPQTQTRHYARTTKEHAGGSQGSGNGLIDYFKSMSNLAEVEFMLGSEVPFTFSRHADRVYLHIDWSTLSVGSWLCVETYMELTATTYPDVFNDMWLKKYMTALFKEQWGSNLKKYTGIQLPGGVTFDGNAIWTEANEEIERLEQEVMSRYQLPPMFFTG